ncbi:MAG: (d)CMP kinase [Anaerorhabdus sp.]
MRINVAIDGPTAAGKGTIAKELAKRLGYQYLDTGAMYRCVAYLSVQNGISLDDESEVLRIIKGMDIRFSGNDEVYLNDENVTKQLRHGNISLGASDVGKLLNVRKEMVKQQQAIAKGKGIVMDGRDIGTVVLPDAEVKIFLTADANTRAERRFLENKQKGIETDLEVLKKQIVQRDEQDQNRINSPLLQATDALVVDTTDMTIEEVVDTIEKIIQNKIKEM